MARRTYCSLRVFKSLSVLYIILTLLLEVTTWNKNNSLLQNAVRLWICPHCSIKKVNKWAQAPDSIKCLHYLTGQPTLALFWTTSARSLHGKAWAQFGHGSHHRSFQKGSYRQDHARLNFLHATESPSIILCDFMQSKHFSTSSHTSAIQISLYWAAE